MSSLVVKNLRKSFRGRRVVDGVSLHLDPGKVVGLLGPNGAGKTTTFYMVVGLVTPDEGTITIGDRSISHLAMHQRARNGLSYLPQEASIFRKLTVSDNILAALEAQGKSGSQKRGRLAELLAEFGLDHISESYGYSLSGGERRRVEIARALAGEPQFILLDEPFAGIDPIAVGDIQNIIRSLTEKEIGVLITDHNVRETLGICDRAYIMKEGRVQVEGAALEVANSEEARRFYLGENFRL